MHIAILAGEKSGDILGASLIVELKKIYPTARFTCVGGEEIKAQDVEIIGNIETLSVMGFAEVIGKLPEILGLKKRLEDFWTANKPDLFIGIDAPDFNLPMEIFLRQKAVKTVHFVSPSIWAWKEKRIKKIKKAVDLMLCLFPFETSIYKEHGITAICTGHPMRERLQEISKIEAREKLSFFTNKFNDNSENYPVLGIFPGSRKSEITKLLPIFLATVNLLKVQIPNLRVIISTADAKYQELIKNICKNSCTDLNNIKISLENSSELISASDAVMLASGTISLETALLSRPMTVAYKVHSLTAFIARRLLKINKYSLPNLLAGREIVPERIQEDCTPELLANDCLSLLQDDEIIKKQLHSFAEIRENMPKNAAETAAKAIAELMNK